MEIPVRKWISQVGRMEIPVRKWISKSSFPVPSTYVTEALAIVLRIFR